MFSPAQKNLFVKCAPATFVFLWSTGFVGARYGLPYAEPFTLTAIRFSIVTILLCLLIFVRRVQFSRSWRMWAHLAVSGILIHSCYIGGIFSAIDLGVDISVAALIAGGQPLLTAIIAVIFLGERLNLRQWSGFIVGFMGLFLVVFKSLDTDALPILGLVGCVVGLIGITAGTLYQKRFVVGIDLFSASAVQFGFALLPCVLWSFALETREIEWNLTVILALLWLCFVLSLGAISILLFLIRMGAASRVSSLFYLVPPVTAVQGYWLFGERLGVAQIIGIAVAALGVALINYATPGKPAATVVE